MILNIFEEPSDIGRVSHVLGTKVAKYVSFLTVAAVDKAHNC